jgi:hypothetical protein
MGGERGPEELELACELLLLKERRRDFMPGEWGRVKGVEAALGSERAGPVLLSCMCVRDMRRV